MRRLWIAVAAPALLLTAEIASGPAAPAGVRPPPPGYEPLPFAYGPPHGYRPHVAHGRPAAYVPPPYAYGAPRDRGQRPDYGPTPGHALPPYAYGSPSGYGSNPEHRLPPSTYDPLPYAMPRDPNPHVKVWNEIADSLREALLQARLASSHDSSRFTSRFAHATRAR